MPGENERFFLQVASRRLQSAEKNNAMHLSGSPRTEVRGSPDKNQLFCSGGASSCAGTLNTYDVRGSVLNIQDYTRGSPLRAEAPSSPRNVVCCRRTACVSTRLFSQ